MRVLYFVSFSQIRLTRVHGPVDFGQSKIRRPSLFIPTPKAFVHSVLAKLAPSSTFTSYWTYATVGVALARAAQGDASIRALTAERH